MRLIDADALMENYNLKDATKYGNRDAEQQNHSYSTMMLYEVADMIEDAPEIEAAPVVHGEWIDMIESKPDHHTGECYEEVYYNCSICDYASDDATNFCPNCGAKMKAVRCGEINKMAR